MGRRPHRALATILAIAFACFDAAWADEAGVPEEPAPAAAPTEPTPAAAPSDPSTAAAEPLATAPPGPNPWVDGLTKAFDVVPIRLLSSTSVVVGFGAFVASVPLVGPGFQLEGIKNSWDYFVMGPYEYTFVRPLGDF